MKTTIEIPDPLFRKAKSRAAERGQTLKEFVTEALQTKIVNDSAGDNSNEPKWMGGFGKLRRLRKETARIQGKIDDWGRRRRAVIATGDNRFADWNRLGKHDCWIKLGEHSVEALRQALLADEARITYAA